MLLPELIAQHQFATAGMKRSRRLDGTAMKTGDTDMQQPTDELLFG
jgi:hypothetical protein